MMKFNLSINMVIDFEFYHTNNIFIINFLFYIIYIIEMTYLNFYMM